MFTDMNPIVINNSTNANREINFMLHMAEPSGNGVKFNVNDFESFEILITKIDNASFPMHLEVSNDDITYTEIKTWNTEQDYYENIFELAKNYQYFQFRRHNTGYGYGARFLIRAITNSSTKEFTFTKTFTYVTDSSDITTAYNRICDLNFKTSDYTAVAVKVNTLPSAYRPSLYVSNSDILWTSLKTWTATSDTFEDITDLIKDYEYFCIHNTSTGYSSNFTFKFNTI